jgi:hypothetical protein
MPTSSLPTFLDKLIDLNREFDGIEFTTKVRLIHATTTEHTELLGRELGIPDEVLSLMLKEGLTLFDNEDYAEIAPRNLLGKAHTYYTVFIRKGESIKEDMDSICHEITHCIQFYQDEECVHFSDEQEAVFTGYACAEVLSVYLESVGIYFG